MTTSLAVRTRPRPGQFSIVGTVPLVRVRPAPQFEPPYDDEATTPGHGRLPIPEPDANRATPVPAAQPPAQPRPQQHGADPASARPAGGAPPRMSGGGQAAYRYVGLCLEVLDGFRPVTHLRRFTVPAAFDAVAGQLARPTARSGHRPRVEAPGVNFQQPASGAPGGGTPRQAPGGSTGRPAPSGREGRAAPGAIDRHAPGVAGRVVPGAAGQSGAGAAGRSAPGASIRFGGERIRLRRMRVAEPRDGAVEVVAVLGRAGRAWALALRLERREGAWLCTHAEVV